MAGKTTYQITRIVTGGNVVKVTATAEEDGDLTIYDLSYGTAADDFYCEDSEVEVWLKLSPENTQGLGQDLLGSGQDATADKVAKLLAERYADENLVLRKIQELLDELNIPYERAMWP